MGPGEVLVAQNVLGKHVFSSSQVSSERYTLHPLPCIALLSYVFFFFVDFAREKISPCFSLVPPLSRSIRRTVIRPDYPKNARLPLSEHWSDSWVGCGKLGLEF
eukprot:sb/3478053/